MSRDEWIRSLYESGKSIREIAPMVGITPSNVRRAVIRAGGTMRPVGSGRPSSQRGLLGWVRS